MNRRHRARARVCRSCVVVLPASILAIAGTVFAQQATPQQQSAQPLARQQQIQPWTPVDPDTVYLASGRIHTPVAVPQMTLREAVAQAEPRQRHVIQLDGPITPERRAAIEGAGIRLHDYLPSHAYIAELAGADADAVAGLEFVQWHAPFERSWKLAPDLGQRVFTTPQRLALEQNGRMAVIVTLFAGEDVQAAVDEVFETVPNAAVYYSTTIGGQGEISLSVDRGDVAKLADLASVQFIEDAPELTLRNGTTRWIAQSNTVNVTPLYDAGIRGENQVVGVMDGRPDQGHCSLDAGKFLFYNAPAGSDFHGTHVSCTVAGDDSTNVNGRGIAYNANLVFDDIPSFTDTAMYNSLEQHHNQGARVHTNSWGNDGTTNYDSLCRGIDRFSYAYEESLVLFAVTNLSSLKNPDNSKNLLAVGASQDTPNQGNHCSGGVGPTVDGRRKPEIYLPGCSTQSASAGSACSYTSLTGTSMASPAVAGACALVRQYFVDGFYPTGVASPADSLTPSGALIKATALNSTVDMTGVAGYPSNLEGWGRVLLDDTLYFAGDAETLFVDDVRNADGLSTGQNTEYQFNVASATSRLKITLVWTDPPASATTGSGPAWINDLNLEVIGPGATYLGNVFSGGESVTGGTADDKNNVEMVLLSSPAVGSYTVRVDAAAVNQGTQGYALVASGDIDFGPIQLSASLVSTVPELVDLDTPVDVDVQVNQNDDTILGVDLHWSDDNGGSYTTIAMSDTGGGLHTATVPGFTDCADQPAFYVSVEGSLAGVKTLPAGGAADPYTYFLGVETVAFEDDMESDTGWVVDPDATDTATTGLWERADPEATAAQPEDDVTPSPGVLCWVTDGLAGTSLGANDVDGGLTTLATPILDLSGMTNARIGYWRWYSNDTGAAPNADVFTVDISDDAGSTWTNVETVGPAGEGTSGGWFYHEFEASDLVSLTDQVRLRFIADDTGTGSVIEAAVDELRIFTVECIAVPPACAGDLDGDGDTDVFDFGIFASNFGTSGHAPFTNGDLDGDGDVDVFDFGLFATDFGCVP